ncbi:hypothetical protein E2P84_11045 [Burkholderia cepacia]|uniref:Lipoprotein n=1 Tax=Burkholderia cepacia TaxID=292 RepID=A0AAX2RL88_BURCE|nr:hypothetical protein E2P84_11045 [Burkholderia cepacia]TES98859.1 hypothetical protein E3D36_27405 [Burkholderia cepacia]TEU45487.1 hypothetical protein E3D38_26710 [Burkholderia cepacia]TEU45901.1 hypothetical protein E3D37_18855 [Burkholderia cepacia]TEU47184.1 hypothetical protein E3D39_05635 [Burkholderia cepacia]
MDNCAESARTSCAITVDVNWATRHSCETARKLLNRNFCARTACATGYGLSNILICRRKPKLSTELCAPC